VGGACGTRGRGEKSVQYRVLVGKNEGKGLLGTPRHRWEDGIRMDLGGGGVVRIQLAQDRPLGEGVVNVVMNLRVLVPRS
jgi:hypothetical protein